METVNFLFTNKGDLPETAVRSLNSFIQFGHECILWVFSETTNIPDGVIVNDAAEIEPLDEAIDPRHFADYWRLELLYRYGGWWSDLDNICIKSLEDFANEDYVFVTLGHMITNNNIMKAPKGCSFLKDCMDYCQVVNWKTLNVFSLNFQFMTTKLGFHQLLQYIYPNEYFIADSGATDNTYVIHEQGKLFR